MTTTTSNTYYDYDPNAMYSYDPNVAAQYQYWQQQQEYDYSQTGQNPNGEAVQTTVGELDDETVRYYGRANHASVTYSFLAEPNNREKVQRSRSRDSDQNSEPRGHITV